MVIQSVRTVRVCIRHPYPYRDTRTSVCRHQSDHFNHQANPCDEGQTSTEVGTRFEVIAPYRRIVTSHAGALLEATLSPIGATGAL